MSRPAFASVILPLLTLLLYAYLAPQAKGAEPEIEIIQTRGVIGRTIRNHVWSPLVTRLQNHTEHEKRLRVVTSLDVNGLNQWRVNYTREVRLPPYSTRAVNSLIRIDYPAEVLAFLFIQKNDRAFTFADGTTRVFKKFSRPKFKLRTTASNQRDSGQVYPGTFLTPLVHPNAVVLALADGRKQERRLTAEYQIEGVPFILGERADDYAFVNGKAPAYSGVFSNRSLPTENELGHFVHTSRLAINELPTRWAAYEGLDFLLLGSLRGRRGAGETGLSPAQRRALLRWIRAGGRLIIAPAYDLAAYRQPFWEQLLPVRLVGWRPLQAEWAAAESTYGKKLTFDHDRPPRLVEALPGVGKMLLKDHERVLLARRKIGNGEVWFTALTGEAMREWSASPALWGEILRRPPEPVPGVRDNFPDYAPNFLGRVIGVKVASRTTMAIILLGYFTLAAASLLFFRRKGRAELGWLLVVILAPLGAGAALVVDAATGEAGLIQGEIGVTVLSPNEARGEVNNFVGLYSSSSRRDKISWANPSTLATATASTIDATKGGKQSKILTVKQGRRLSFPDTRIPKRELIGIRSQSLVTYGKGLDFSCGFDESGVRGRVVNNTGRDLVDCLVRLNRRTLRIGTLKAGESFDLAKGKLVWNLYTKDGIPTEAEKLRSDILAELLRYPRQPTFARRRVFTWPLAFYGWSKISRAEITCGKDKPLPRSYQLLVVPADGLRGKGRVRIPAGVCGLKFFKRSSSRLGGTFGFPRQPPRATREEVRFPLPNQKKRRKPKRKIRRKTPAGKNRPPANFTMQAAPEVIKPVHAVAGWLAGDLYLPRLKVPLAFILPRSLRGLKVEKIWLITNMDFVGAKGSVEIRRAGDKKFTPLRRIKLGGRTRTEIRNLKKYLGARGELPEFRLLLKKIAKGAMTAPGKYTIREFDLTLEGTM